MPSVPQAVIATSKKNGALARPPSGGVVKNRMICPDIRHHHALTAAVRQQRRRGREFDEAHREERFLLEPPSSHFCTEVVTD
jgi:hypothetical protein